MKKQSSIEDLVQAFKQKCAISEEKEEAEIAKRREDRRIKNIERVKTGEEESEDTDCSDNYITEEEIVIKRKKNAEEYDK